MNRWSEYGNLIQKEGETRSILMCIDRFGIQLFIIEYTNHLRKEKYNIGNEKRLQLFIIIFVLF